MGEWLGCSRNLFKFKFDIYLITLSMKKETVKSIAKGLLLVIKKSKGFITCELHYITDIFGRG